MSLEKFSPNNLHQLDAEGVKELQSLTIEQIGELAEKYNTPNNYLAVVNTANKGNQVVTPATYRSIISAHKQGFTKLQIVDTLANYKANATAEINIPQQSAAVIDLGKIDPLVQKSIEVEDSIETILDEADAKYIEAKNKEFKTEFDVLLGEAEKELNEAIEMKRHKQIIAKLKKNIAELHQSNTQK